MRKITFDEVAHHYIGIKGVMGQRDAIMTLTGVEHVKTGRQLTVVDPNGFVFVLGGVFRPYMHDVKYIQDETLIKVMKSMSLNDLSKASFNRNGYRWDNIGMRAWLNDDEFEEISWVDYNHFEYEHYNVKTKQRHSPETFNPQYEALLIMLADGYDFFNLLENRLAIRFDSMPKY